MAQIEITFIFNGKDKAEFTRDEISNFQTKLTSFIADHIKKRDDKTANKIEWLVSSSTFIEITKNV